jgi:hypothetical protein
MHERAQKTYAAYDQSARIYAKEFFRERSSSQTSQALAPSADNWAMPHISIAILASIRLQTVTGVRAAYS